MCKILMCLCLEHDVATHTITDIYVFAAAYGFGLLVTFGALAIMGSGQPALLYIVPLTLGTTVLVGWRRKELRQLWTGQPVGDNCQTVLETCSIDIGILSVRSSLTLQYCIETV